MSPTQRQTNNRIFIVALGLIVFAVFYALSAVLAPFFAGALIAYLCDPLVTRLMRWGVPRSYAALIVFLTALIGTIAIILLTIPLIETQVTALIRQLPQTVLWLSDNSKALLAHYDINFSFDANTFKNLLTDYITKAGGILNWLFFTSVNSGKKIFEILLYLFLIPIVAFYLLRDWDLVLSGLESILPRKFKRRVITIAKECDEVIGAFFRGQLLVMLALGIYYSIGLTLLGLNVGVVIGLIIGLISIVPYLGSIVGILIAALTTYTQFGDTTHLIWLAVLFAIGHFLENFVLSPLLIGNRVGLHPVAVIFAILAGGTLFGLLGVLLAIPFAAIILIILRHLLKHYHARVDDLG